MRQYIPIVLQEDFPPLYLVRKGKEGATGAAHRLAPQSHYQKRKDTARYSEHAGGRVCQYVECPR